MKVGINGMGRMGRLALRAAMGGVHRLALCWLITLILPATAVTEVEAGQVA